MKKYVLTHLLLFILLVDSTNLLAQTNLYISASGNNNGSSNPCTDAINPCRTFDHVQTQAVSNYSAATKVIINFVAGAYTTLTISRSNTTLSGAQANVVPDPMNRRDRVAESRFELSPNPANINSITIANGVNNVTIEGFEFRSNRNSATVPLIALGGANTNILLRRNSIVGSSAYSGGGSYNLVQPFLLSTGTLTNIQIVENRFYGYKATTNTPVISISSAESGAIRSNYFGSDVLNATIPQSTGDNDLDNAIILGGVKNFAIAQNHFQRINFNAIELLNTLNVATLNNDAIIRIDSNIFDRTNSELSSLSSGTVGITEPTIAAGILLRPHNDAVNTNNFAGDSVLIRFNDFVGNNRYAIAIPNANNNYTTSGIKIFSNRFSTNNTGNSYADLYVGTDTKTNGGIINANANWWGNTASPFSPVASTTFGLSTDIQGAAANTALSIIQRYIALSSSTDNNPGNAFIPNQVARGRSTSAELNEAFNAIPENWTLELPTSDYENAPIVPTIVRSFTLNPLDVTADGELFPGFILNGSNYDGSAPVMTLSKNIQIANGANVTLTKGKIQLGTYNMRVLGSSGLPDGNEESYIITNSIGKLIQTGIGTAKTGEVIFPVGPDNISYAPARITNTGVSDNFSVSVERGINLNSVPINGNDGNTVTQYAVDLTWQVDEEIDSSSNATITLQWNNDPLLSNFVDEQTGFNPDISYIAHYNTTTSKWENLEVPPGTPATGGSITGSLKKTASGITSFSPFAIGSPGAALPVTLVDFKAALNNHDVELSWITASEKDNAHFSVERSEDGSTFREIGKIEGKGTTDISNTYNFTDVFATETGRDILYYRLKQVDTDGKFSYSKIQDVVLQTWALRLFPNPADRVVNIALPGRAHLQVISSQGQVVMEKEFESLTQLNVSSLAKGMYIFKLTNGRDVLFKKVNIF